MLNVKAKSQIHLIRRFLDASGFQDASVQITPRRDDAVHPSFAALQAALQNANPLHRFLFSIFRQGHSAAQPHLRRHIPEEVFAACLEVGLLVQDSWGDYSTPGVTLACFDGLLALASLPTTYPTAIDVHEAAHVGVDTLRTIAALPSTLMGRSVCNPCAGSGLVALACAARGAARVVALESSAEARNVAEFNAVLNGYDSVVEVEQSIASSGAVAWDFLVANPLFAALGNDSAFPMARGRGGAPALSSVVDAIEANTAASFHGVLVTHAAGDADRIFVNAELSSLSRRLGFGATAFVSEKLPVAQYVRQCLLPLVSDHSLLLADKDRQQLCSELVAEIAEVGAEFVYDQTLRLAKPSKHSGINHVPIYHAQQTDTLMRLVRNHQAVA